jgi:hypothetical protein
MISMISMRSPLHCDNSLTHACVIRRHERMYHAIYAMTGDMARSTETDTHSSTVSVCVAIKYTSLHMFIKASIIRQKQSSECLLQVERNSESEPMVRRGVRTA